MAKEFGSFFGSRLGERIRSPLGEFGSPAAYLLMGMAVDTGGGRHLQDQLDRYEEDHWGSRPDHPNVLWNHVAWGFLGRVHICAGHKGNFEFTDEHNRYDNQTETWESMLEISAPARTDAIALQAGSRVHVTGGKQQEEIDNDEGLLRLHDSWIETDQTWVALPQLPKPKRHKQAGFVIDGRVIVVGGGTKNTGLGNFRTGDATEYDPLTMTWAQLQELPVTGVRDTDIGDWPEQMASATAYAGTRGYVFMGNASISIVDNWVRFYRRSDDTWSEGVYVPGNVPGRSEEEETSVEMRTPSAVSLGGVMHLMGGGSEGFREEERFDDERYNLRFDHYGDVWDERRRPPAPARSSSNVVAP